jgi:hypothetical protein
MSLENNLYFCFLNSKVKPHSPQPRHFIALVDKELFILHQVCLNIGVCKPLYNEMAPVTLMQMNRIQLYFTYFTSIHV